MYFIDNINIAQNINIINSAINSHFINSMINCLNSVLFVLYCIITITFLMHKGDV